MARVVDAFVAVEPSCAYLPQQVSHTEIFRIDGVSSREYERLLLHGWRRFGNRFFRPRCPGCAACIPIRVPVHAFRPGAEHRRVLKKCRDVTLSVARPVADGERLDLFNRWQEFRRKTRGWTQPAVDLETYRENYCYPHEWAYEMGYRIGGKLSAVGLVDRTPSALSSVFFYFDPDLKVRSLGTFGVLAEIGFAARSGLSYLYLGYWVAECPSLAYKSRFRPHELLQPLPGPDESPRWMAAPAPDAPPPAPSH